MDKILKSLKDNKKILFSLLGILVFIVVSVLIGVYAIPMIKTLTQEEAKAAFKAKIDGFGFGGVLIMLAIQILQILVAFIPGEPIEILMGVMYGTIGGLAISTLGCAIGSGIVFFAVRKIGQPLFEFFFEKKYIDRFEFLKNSKKLEIITFILFFIPGTPKDVLTYFAPLTPIDAKIFLMISVFARIPSIITSTYAGSSILEGNIVKTIIIFAATAIIGIIGIIIGNKITDKESKENNE